ncbi:MAG: hypothetical protein KIT19_07225 [Phycisphaeraceae bacterium]|nr:hypothetical protein [Phycisphaeraceae bacterium]
MASNPETLTCVSILVCDDIYRDEMTKKMVIVGTFNHVFSRTMPASLPKSCILISLTNGNGDYDLSVVIEHEKSGNEIFRVGGPMTVKSPLDIVDLDIRLHDLKLPDVGKYWVQVREGARILGQRPLIVQELTGNPAEVEES